MTPELPPIAPETETGSLGVYHLKRLWSRTMSARMGINQRDSSEWHLDQILLHGLGIGLEQVLPYLNRTGPSFEEFEAWILALTGPPDPLRVARINAEVEGAPKPEVVQRWLDEVDAAEPTLSAEDLAFWDEHGYVVIHDAVDPEALKATEALLWAHLGASADDVESWYRARTNGIMVQFFQHPLLEANRRALRIHKAFAQLWGTADLWNTTDRCGFNVPVRPGAPFTGTKLHWDVSMHQPIPFGTQGILYLTDTEPEQGALTLVPGFHKRMGEWMASLPPNADPRLEDVYALNPQPIGGRAGDFIIWHQALPHGSRPNLAQRPRLVQYINYFPCEPHPQTPWI